MTMTFREYFKGMEKKEGNGWVGTKHEFTLILHTEI